MKAVRILLLILILAAFSNVAVAQVDMEFWFSGTAAQVEFVQAAVDEYNQLQDAIRITLVETPPSRERIATALAAGQGPDLMWYNHNMPWFFGIEAVYPLNDFVSDPEIGIDPDTVFPASRGTVQYAGVVQAIPMRHCPGGLIYNRDIFRQAGLSDDDAPRTWEDVERLAIQLTERDGDRVTQWGLVSGSIDWMLQELVLSNGADWVADDLSRYLTHPERLVEGLEWWSGLHHDHQVTPVPGGVTWAGVEAMQVGGDDVFIRGEAAMRGFGGLCSAAGMRDQNPELDMGGVITPLGPSANGQRTLSLGFDGIFVMAEAPEPREAYLFIKWFFENKALEFMEYSPGSVPSAVAALDDESLANDPLMGFGSVLDAMQEARLRNFHVFPGRLDVRAQEPAMAEAVFLQQASAQEVVDRFVQHADEVFNLYADDLAEFLEEHAIVW
jgi:multiple sugar transport system substrate-binding protein